MCMPIYRCCESLFSSHINAFRQASFCLSAFVHDISSAWITPDSFPPALVFSSSVDGKIPRTELGCTCSRWLCMGQWNVRSDRCLLHIELFKAMCFLALFSFPLLGIKSGGRTWSNHFGPRGRSFVIRKVKGHYQCWPIYFRRVIQERNKVLSCLRQCILGTLCYSK